jgi:hypothetical protein
MTFDFLAVDPGTHTGWAAFYGARLVECGLGDPPVERSAHMIIEVPQVYPQHPVPPNDLILLAFTAGRYAGRAKGVVTIVFPHAWKGNLPKDVCAARVRAKLSLDEQKIVDKCGAAKSYMHNVMDAVGIGLYFLQGKRP